MQVVLADGRAVDVAIKRKKIRNLILRIYPDGTIGMSVPMGVKDAEVRAFLVSRSGWIGKGLRKMEDRRSTQKDGVLKILGEEYRVVVIKDDKDGVSWEHGAVVVFCKNPAEYETAVDRWWRKNALEYFSKAIDKWMPLLGAEGITRPRISVRKMKTMWGSCTSSRGTIRFNYHLYSAPPACVDYVVLHELAHLLHPNHGQGFKSFLTKHMPDWKMRKKMLGELYLPC